MQEWHNRAEDALYALRENHESVTYMAMLDYFSAVYEREKENMVLSNDEETLRTHWIAANGVRSLLADLMVEKE
ncbi:hypothetical protein [Bacterioplanoides sp.]|uniref:hypothetical protein n=1 Tax=Bacterioplanoides sp. TaxID=2066072 RepID=UPI003B59422C